MSSVFWSNTIWYVLLFITSIISMIFVLTKSKNRKFTIAFTLATLGFVYLIESILIIPFNSYTYYPKIVDDLFQDAVLGNVFSQVSISSTSALTIVYGLSYKWYFIFAFFYYLIEEFFLTLGIYQHFWYKSIYTLIGFIPIFFIIKLWHNKVISSSKYFVYYVTLFLGVFAVTANTIMMPMRLLKIQIFTVDFYGDYGKNHTTTAIIYAFILINCLINLNRSRLHWVWKGITLATLFFIQYVFYKSGLIYIQSSLVFIVTLIDILGIYIWIIGLDSFLRQKPNSDGEQSQITVS